MSLKDLTEIRENMPPSLGEHDTDPTERRRLQELRELREATERESQLTVQALCYAMQFPKLRVVVLGFPAYTAASVKLGLFLFTRDERGEPTMTESVFDQARIGRILRGLKPVFKVDEYIV